jgi:iron(III) transport system ATP-binding protein
MTELLVRNIEKKLGALQILKGASFRAERGEILALLGASGSGKTTLLRCIAGLEQPEVGYIEIGGKTALASEDGIMLPPEKRDVGLVFQSYALWPHRKVFDNVAYGLKLRRKPREEMRIRVERILEMLGLGHLADRYPDQLSGGQQQRVAICRALVYEPKVLLLDEPLSNLDAKLREEARFWIRKLILDLQICAVMVTHDQAEALAMADQILLLKDGVIIQEGSPVEMYSKPQSIYAAEFLGANNVFAGKIVAINASRVTINGRGWSLDGVAQGILPLAIDQKATAVVRVERLDLADGPGEQTLQMDVEAGLYLGDHWEYRLVRGDLKVRVRCGAAIESKGGVWCRFPSPSVWIFPSAS